MEHYKAWLVAKGFTQGEGHDFHKTLMPVVNLVSVQVFLTVAAARDESYTKWMPTILFCMEILMRKFAWNYLPTFKLIAWTMFIDSVKPFMGSNKLPRIGSTN